MSNTFQTVDPNSLNIGDKQIIHSAIKTVSRMCDHAQDLDGVGFNKADEEFGNSLAEQKSLSPRQAVAGLRMIIKYHKQLAPDITTSLQSILEGKRIGQGVGRFDIIPEFANGRVQRINVVDTKERKEVLSFCPSQYGVKLKEKFIELGLKSVDINEIVGILQINN